MAAAAATLGGCLGTAQASVMDGVDVTMGVHSAHGQRPASLRAPQRNVPSMLAFVPEKAFGALDVDPGSSISHARTRRAIELEQRLDAAEQAIERAQHAADESWLLVSSTLVLMMTISGLALFYGGLVRVQNVLATVMQSFAIACLVTFMWISFGYSLSFTRGSPVIGSYQRCVLRTMPWTVLPHPGRS